LMSLVLSVMTGKQLQRLGDDLTIDPMPA